MSDQNQTSDNFTMYYPGKCPRGRKDCLSLSLIQSPNSFFCCGENNGANITIEQDKYTLCFKGEFDDRMAHYDKRDLLHEASVIIRALAVVEKDHFNPEGEDWSPWIDKKEIPNGK